MVERRLNRDDVATEANCIFCTAAAPFLVIPRTEDFGDVRRLPFVCCNCTDALGLFAQELSTDVTEWMAVDIEPLFSGCTRGEFFTWGHGVLTTETRGLRPPNHPDKNPNLRHELRPGS